MTELQARYYREDKALNWDRIRAKAKCPKCGAGYAQITKHRNWCPRCVDLENLVAGGPFLVPISLLEQAVRKTRAEQRRAKAWS